MTEHMFDLVGDLIGDAGSRPADEWEQLLVNAEAEIGRLRSVQVAALRRLDVAQIVTADGARSLNDWVAGRLDISHDTARALVTSARSMRRSTAESLVSGEIGFERAFEETRLVVAGVEDHRITGSRGWDLAGVRRLAARHRRISRREESEVAASQHLIIQPNLNETAWTLHGLLAAVEGRLVEKALHQRGDELADESGTRISGAMRSALALASICQDSLGGNEPGSAAEPLVTIMVDAVAASGTNGEAGAAIVAGPRVGPNTLEELLCNGKVELNVAQPDGFILGIGPTTSAIPPRLRRHILARDGACVIAGCRSRYRLQTHHIRERSHGGDHHPENLATLCWFHHHVAIHGLGHTIDPDSPPGRRRLKPPP